MTVAVAASLGSEAGAAEYERDCYNVLVVRDINDLWRVTNCGLTALEVQSHVQVVSVTDYDTELSYWPPALCRFSALTSINLSGNAITFIPQSVQLLTGLKVLSVARNNLTSAPPELSCLTGLTELDLSRNELRALHPALCNLKQLKVLNVMGNQIVQLPDQFGDLSGLIRLGLKSNKLAKLPDSFSQLTNLVELFITDNQLTTLPQGFGNLRSLVKLQASFNPFTHLPDGVWQLPELEMFRLAVGHLACWPADLLKSRGLPKLAWCSLGRNPAAAAVPRVPDDLPRVDVSQLVIGHKLGQGASGEVFKGVYQGDDVAIKIFVAEVSPDGSTQEELAINCAMNHPNLTKVLALVVDNRLNGQQEELGNQQQQLPAAATAAGENDTAAAAAAAAAEGSADVDGRIIGMVLQLVDGKPLAGRPTSEHLLRCRWQEGQQFSTATTLSICHGVASSLAYLHSRSTCHGDVYAHNIMVNDQAIQQGLPAQPVMCDFGAAYCYDKAALGQFWEAMEVRAYGLFMKDLVDRTELNASSSGNSHLEVGSQLNSLVSRCLAEQAASRPMFEQVEQELLLMMEAAAVPVMQR